MSRQLPRSRRIGLWTDLDVACVGDRAVALVPLGSIEPHAHLPLATDSLIPDAILEKVAERTEDAWLFPVLPVGFLFKYSRWPGAVGIGAEVLTGVLRGICDGLARWGFHHLLVMSGHDENREPALTALREAHLACGIRSVYCDWLDLGLSILPEVSVSRREGHASEIQTSVVRFLLPELSIELPGPSPDDLSSSAADADDFFAPRDQGTWIRMVPAEGRRAFSGDPRAADPEKGRIVFEHIVGRAAALIEELRA